MSINVDKWYDNNKKAVYLYMRKKYPSDINRDQFGCGEKKYQGRKCTCG